MREAPEIEIDPYDVQNKQLIKETLIEEENNRFNKIQEFVHLYEDLLLYTKKHVADGGINYLYKDLD